MTLGGMRLVLLTLALQPTPPDRVVEGPRPADVIGVAWHDEATVDGDIRQRVRAGLAAGAGVGVESLVEPAVPRARVSLASRVSDRDVAGARAARRALDAARQAFRAGDFETAAAGARGVLGDLRQAPAAPGAARIAFWAHVLRAQIAWAAGEDPSEPLRDAIRIDPGASLSTRYVPPPLAARYEAARGREMAQHPRWPTPVVTLAGDETDPSLTVEIDGLPGLRPVPPGSHFIVVRRHGRAPVGAYREAERPWEIPSGRPLLRESLPTDPADAQTVCDALGLTVVVLVRESGRQIGLHAYRCGEGFTTPWVGAEEALEAGAGAVLDAPSRGGRSTFGAEPPWPHRASLPVRAPATTPVADKPAWFRRPWVWVLVGTVVVGAVATGLAVGLADGPPVVTVDADQFRSR